MRFFWLLLLCISVLPACRKQAVLDGESVSTANRNNPELLRITREAQAGLSFFFRLLTAAEDGEGGFCVKYPFTSDSGGVDSEQMWLTGIRFRNNRYYGKLANTPVHVSGMKKGDTVSFIPDNITDWMYVKNGEIIGGRSIKYLLEQIPEKERTERQNRLLEMFDH